MQVSFNETNEGFWAEFDNGWTMSVQWRPGNYADKNTVEIAAWDENKIVWWDFWAGKPAPTKSFVLGWVTSEELVEYMDDIASITMGSMKLRFVLWTEGVKQWIKGAVVLPDPQGRVKAALNDFLER